MSASIRFLGSGDSFGSGGRFQTCILVEIEDVRFLLDCGASSLIAMRAQGIEPNDIDVILLTHMHGDHCAGVPFVLLDAMLGSKRRRPLTVAGPAKTTSRMDALREALFPGSHAMRPQFEYAYVELKTRQVTDVHGLAVTAYPALHTPETSPTMLRVEYAGKTVAYSGDTAWTEDLATASRGIDVLICECYFYDKPIKMHMTYATFQAHRSELTAKSIVLTHMSADMLAHAPDIPERTAYDGLVIDF